MARIGEDTVLNDVMTFQFAKKITPVHFIKLLLLDEKGNEVANSFYWRSTNKYEGSKTMTGPATAGFQNCTIRAKTDSYITAANTTQGKKFGFVFLDCKIIADSSVTKLALGRPWRAYSRTAFIRCQLPKVIAPAGWNNWGNPENEKTAFYAEYKNTGEGADTKSRAVWSKQLSDKEAKDHTVENILLNANSTVQDDANWFKQIPLASFDWPTKK